MSMATATLDDFVDGGNPVAEKGSKVRLRKSKKTPQEKHLHMVLKGDSVARLERLQAIVHPPTQTGAVTTALQLFEAFINEYEAGSEFYIKREGDSGPIKYEIFD